MDMRGNMDMQHEQANSDLSMRHWHVSLELDKHERDCNLSEVHTHSRC